MKKYKKLQEKVDASLSEMKDEQLLRSLKAQTCQNKERKSPTPKRKWTWAFASALSVVLICVISLVVWAPILNQDMGQDGDMGGNSGDSSPPWDYENGGPSPVPPPSNEDPVYDSDNESQVATSFEELNSLTQFFDVYPPQGFSVSKYVDSVTGDVLYFVVSGTNTATSETYTIKIIVNQYYKENGYEHDYNLQAPIGDQNMSYFEECEIDSEGYYNYTIVAKIITSKERIFVQYSGVTHSTPNPYVTSIREILK